MNESSANFTHAVEAVREGGVEFMIISPTTALTKLSFSLIVFKLLPTVLAFISKFFASGEAYSSVYGFNGSPRHGRHRCSALREGALVGFPSCALRMNIRGCESRSWCGSEPVVIYVNGVGESRLWRVGEPPWLGSFRRVDWSRDERSMYPWYERLGRS